MEDKVEEWVTVVWTLSGVALRNPQTSYTGLQKSLQKEWEFVQQVTTHIKAGGELIKN